MLFKKTKNDQLQSVRSRRPATASSESFRRNAVVFSKRQKELAQAHQSVTQRQIERQRAAQNRKFKIRTGLILLAAFFGVLCFRMNLTAVTLETNASSKFTPTDVTLYSSTIESEYKRYTIAGQWWLADQEAMIAALKKQFPEIEHISLSSSAPFSTSLKADIRFRKAVFTWVDASDQQQFVDKNGVLFSKNLDPSVNPTKLIKIEDQSGIVIDAGNAVLTEPLIRFIGQLHSKLPPLYVANAKISRVIIPESTREVQVQVDGTSYLIKFSSVHPIDNQIGELSALLNYLKSKNIQPSEYIDMRVPHKAFYK